MSRISSTRFLVESEGAIRRAASTSVAAARERVGALPLQLHALHQQARANA